MCVGGVWQDIVIDDYLPVNQYGEIAFASTQDGSIWASLLEKAWAKLCGSYENIINGTADMGFIHLCGMPSLDYKHGLYKSNKNEFWRALSAAKANGHIVVAGTSDKNSDREYLRADGIVANHCYTLLSTHETRVGN